MNQHGATRGAFIGALALVCALFIGSAPAAAQSASAAPAADLGNPCGSGLPLSAAAGGGANNMVIVHNPTGGDLQLRGSVQLNHVPGPTVGNVNCAAALAGAPNVPTADVTTLMCVGCQTVAVALQIDLISRSATRITPLNVARAQNIRCGQCVTIAVAMQYVIQVDDPTQVPPDAADLARSMDNELHRLQVSRTVTAVEAINRVIAVVNQFQTLAANLSFQRSDAPASP